MYNLLLAGMYYLLSFVAFYYLYFLQSRVEALSSQNFIHYIWSLSKNLKRYLDYFKLSIKAQVKGYKIETM